MASNMDTSHQDDMSTSTEDTQVIGNGANMEEETKEEETKEEETKEETEPAKKVSFGENTIRRIERRRSRKLPSRAVTKLNKFSSNYDEKAAVENEKAATEKAASQQKKRKQNVKKMQAKKPSPKKPKLTEKERLEIEAELEKASARKEKTLKERLDRKKMRSNLRKMKRGETKKQHHVNKLMDKTGSKNFFYHSASAQDIEEWLDHEDDKEPLSEEKRQQIRDLKDKKVSKAKHWREVARDVFEQRWDLNNTEDSK